MSTDLHPNPRLEERLREAFDAVIPHLMDDEVESAIEHGERSDERASGRDSVVEERRSSRLLGIAAAVLIVGGAAAVWSASTRPDLAVIDPATPASVDVPAATTAASNSTQVGRTVSTDVAPPTGSSVPCLIEDCTPVDRLPVVDGAFDFYAGPETLGTPVVDQQWLERIGLVRCLELTADGTACRRIEGLASVSLVAYPSIGVEIGTTFTSITAADYVSQWGVSGAGLAPTADVVVRGHDGIRFPYGDRDYVVWPERDGVLAWVTAPSSMSDELLRIAEGVRELDGPTTIPFLVVTGLGSAWDASDNDSDGVVYARIGDAICVGIGWVPDPCSRVVTRETPDGTGARQIAGIGPTGAVTARVELEDSSSYDFVLAAVQGLADEPGFLGALPAVDGSLTLSWLDADGAVLAAERIEMGNQPGIVVATTAPIGPELMVLVANASNVNGAAGRLTQMISERYSTFDPVSALEMRERSIVYYAAGAQPAAEDLAEQIGGADIAPMPDTSTVLETGAYLTDVLVLIGNDRAPGLAGLLATTTTG
jgi:hypothetical protein